MNHNGRSLNTLWGVAMLTIGLAATCQKDDSPDSGSDSDSDSDSKVV